MNNIEIRYLKNIIVGVFLLVLGVIFVNKVLLKKKKETVNFYFAFVIFTFYMVSIFTSIKPFFGFNLTMLTPISNVSPMLFTLASISLIAPKKIKAALYKVFAIFNVVMVIAGFYSATFALVTNTSYFNFVMFDELSHVCFGLFSYYLIVSGQVKLSKKDMFIISLSFVGIIAFVCALNIIFDTSFFGLCLNDKYNIYGLKIVNRYWLSDLIYVCGLAFAISTGYLLYRLFAKIKNKLKV